MPIERDPREPLDAFYARILIALAKMAGGELRIKEDLIESDCRHLLVRDWDPVTNEIVFRVMSRYAEAAWVAPRQSQWTIPFEERARALGLDEAQRHHVPTDEEMAQKERQQNLRRQTRPVAPPVDRGGGAA
jgi:hypothetical protein